MNRQDTKNAIDSVNEEIIVIASRMASFLSKDGTIIPATSGQYYDEASKIAVLNNKRRELKKQLN